MHFFSFFDVLPSAPTTTEMTLMLLIFHIFLISLFGSWYLSFFSFSFSLTLMSPCIVISIMAQLLSFSFTRTISDFLALISLSHWIITSYKIFTSSFSTTPSRACSYHFSLLFRLYFPHNFQWTILATLLRLLLYSFCANCSHSQYEILFHFSCHTFYKVVIGLFYLSCVSHSLFELLVTGHHTTWLMFQLSGQLFSATTMFLFHLLFLAFLLQTIHIFFCFFIAPSFPFSLIPSYSLYHFILLFLQLSRLQSMAQLNSWHTIPSCVIYYYYY